MSFKPAAQRAGLGLIGWHTFRRTFSTLLRANGEDIKVQQELMRHADIRTTMNLYTQADSDQTRQAHEKIVGMVLPGESETCSLGAPSTVGNMLKAKGKMVGAIGFEPTSPRIYKHLRDSGGNQKPATEARGTILGR